MNISHFSSATKLTESYRVMLALLYWKVQCPSELCGFLHFFQAKSIPCPLIQGHILSPVRETETGNLSWTSTGVSSLMPP